MGAAPRWQPQQPEPADSPSAAGPSPPLLLLAAGGERSDGRWVLGTEPVAIARGSALRWWPAGAGNPAPTASRWCGERRRTGTRCASTNGGAWTPLTRSGRRSRSSNPWPDGGGLGLVSRDLEAINQVGPLPISPRKTCGAALEAPAGGSRPLTALRGPPPALCPAQGSNRLGRTAWCRQRPGKPGQRSTGASGNAAAAAPFSENRKAAGPVALLPPGGELIVPEAGGLALRTAAAPAESSGRCCRKPRSQQFLSRWPAPRPGWCGHFGPISFRRSLEDWWNPARRPLALGWAAKGWLA